MFKSYLKTDNFILLDGAMGTALQGLNLPVGAQCELLNIENPELILKVHKSFVEAGSKVLYANTFAANIKKIPDERLLKEVITSGLRLAKEAGGGRTFTALDIGPTGELIEPMGSLSFDGAYEVFKQVIDIAGGLADLIVIETMSSLYELKAALLAARENSGLAVIATMSFEENGRTFTGCTPSAFALTASPLSDMLGVNCCLGPDKLLPVVEQLSLWTDKPLVVKANAGLPDQNGKFSASPREFAACYSKFIELGARAIGGCCGTTPDHIKELARLIDGKVYRRQQKIIPAAVCSERITVELKSPVIVGERINPTGKKAMQQALLSGNYDFIKQQAAEQGGAGADILDVNTGVAGIDEPAAMRRAVGQIMSISDLPLQIDSKDTAAIEAGLRYYAGKAIVNSVTGEDGVMDAVFPLVKKYGAAVIGLTIDQSGIPQTAEKRLEIAKKILKKAKKYQISPSNVIIDCLTLTVSAEQLQAKETLKAIGLVKQKLGLNTILGVSNVSFGLPQRNIINTAFLTLAFQAGLDMAIINPNIKEYTDAIDAIKVLSGVDLNAAEFIAKHAQPVNLQPSPMPALKTGFITENIPKPEPSLYDGLLFAVLNGLGAKTAQITDGLLNSMPPLEIIDKFLIPSLSRAGELFESGRLFLPQLIAAAESARRGFDCVKQALEKSGGKSLFKGKIVLATVKGDIHDIGKNIVKILLENHGYTVIDLGKNVDQSVIIETCVKQDIRLCGLSALMTTTAANMKDTAAALKKALPGCKIMVGGAVITGEFANSIGADFYAKDANQAVRFAQKVFG